MRIQQLLNRFMVKQNHGFTPFLVACCFILQFLMQQGTHYVGVFGQVTDPSTVQIGDTVCFEGYVMDYYCIDRGTLLDNPRVSTLVGPDQHSVHCLVDVDECFTSPFEILGDPVIGNGTANDGNDTTLYTRAYRVDDAGRSMIIELARSHGSCGTCTGSSESDSTPIVKQGFRAEIYGTVVALSSDSNGFVPVQVQVTEAKRSNNQASVCGLTRVTPAPAPSDGDSDSSKGSNDTGIIVLSAIVVLMAATLAVLSLYFGIVDSPKASK